MDLNIISMKIKKGEIVETTVSSIQCKMLILYVFPTPTIIKLGKSEAAVYKYIVFTNSQIWLVKKIIYRKRNSQKESPIYDDAYNTMWEKEDTICNNCILPDIFINM